MNFLDDTVLPALMLQNDKRSYDILNYLMELPERAAISTITAGRLTDAGRKVGVADSTLSETLSQYVMLAVTQDDYLWKLENEDDEDDDVWGALQLASALRAGCDTFVTVDHERAKRFSSHLTMRPL